MVAIGLIAGVLCGTIVAVVWYRVGRREGYREGYDKGRADHFTTIVTVPLKTERAVRYGQEQQSSN